MHAYTSKRKEHTLLETSNIFFTLICEQKMLFIMIIQIIILNNSKIKLDQK